MFPRNEPAGELRESEQLCSDDDVTALSSLKSSRVKEKERQILCRPQKVQREPGSQVAVGRVAKRTS